MSELEARIAALPDKSLLLLDDDQALRTRMGRALEARGHRVRRINFSSGDWLFWRLPSDNYRGRFDKWGAYVADYVRTHGVTDIVLFGDCRPYHVAATAAAQPFGVRFHVFEEGYLRPNWITCELGGVNGNSALPKTADEIRAATGATVTTVAGDIASPLIRTWRSSMCQPRGRTISVAASDDTL